MGIFVENNVEVSPFYFSWIVFQMKQYMMDPVLLSNMEDINDIQEYSGSEPISKIARSLGQSMGGNQFVCTNTFQNPICKQGIQANGRSINIRKC